MNLIEVDNVSKEFQIFQRPKGLIPSLRSLITRKYITKTAVDQISFNITRGELVGYIGSNGAGKSTTIKMLSGILLPTKGKIKVDGIEPYKNRKENARKIGVVFGQRSQLYWNLPMEETFDLYRRIYKVNYKQFKNNVNLYVELLEMKDFLRTPVRQLSLGQRMRAELVVSLLHDPDILYLDEPTIGLDVMVKQRIRKFIREIRTYKDTTVILTTHDMDDIEQICDRIITIDNGKILFDGTTQQFKEAYSQGNMLIVEFVDHKTKQFDNRLEVIKEDGLKKWFLINKNEIGIAEAIATITRNYEIKDINIVEPKVEDSVKEMYEKQRDSTVI